MKTAFRWMACLALLAHGIVAMAQDAYPSRPVTLIVPYPPGGAVDAFARAFAEGLKQDWKAGVVIENKPGANEVIGASALAKSKPDGYTVMVSTEAAAILNPLLFKKLPYDPDKDFVLISWMDAGHLPLIVNSKLPVKNLAELADYARANKTSLGTYGAGSYSHVAVEALNRHYKLGMEAVHYRGEAPMWQDVASGAVQGGSGSVAAASGVLQSGNGRPIAVPTKERMKKLPDVPTFYEQGVTDKAFQVQGWIGLVGPAGMPKEIVQKLSDMMVEGGKSERIQKILTTFGIDNAARDHIFFEKIVAEQGPTWIDLVKGLNIEPQ